MTKAIRMIGLLAIAVPTAALSQMGPGSTADGTANVRSQSLGGPGQSNNPIDQYSQRQGLQEVSGGQAAAPPGKLGLARPAKKDELVAGAPVNDKTGVAIARIETVDADGVVVSVDTAKIKVPADAFGHNNAGLLLDMTKAQFEQVVASASAGH